MLLSRRLPAGDDAIEAEILRLQLQIETWARSHDIWYDCGFKSFEAAVDAKPWNNSPVVTVIWAEGDFNNAVDYDEKLSSEFDSLLEEQGYWYERGICRFYIYATDKDLNERFKDYFYWKWVCSLVAPDFSDFFHELYEYFSGDPTAMQRLHPREFETLIYELLRLQGFNVELGPYVGDGGIDIKILQRDPIGDILTAIQVKRYRKDRKIDLSAVQALHGAKSADGIPNSMFVTTSDYLPSARQFAGRSNVSMKLYTSREVQEWCEHAREGIIEDKSRLISPNHIHRRLSGTRTNFRGNIVSSKVGVSMDLNSFALILKETNNAALLMELPKQVVEDDGFGQRGEEIAIVDLSAFESYNKNGVFRAKKTKYDGRDSGFWTGEHLYTPWDGRPCRFDYCD